MSARKVILLACYIQWRELGLADVEICEGETSSAAQLDRGSARGMFVRDLRFCRQVESEVQSVAVSLIFHVKS